MHLLTSNFAVEVSSLFLRQTSLSINLLGSNNSCLPIAVVYNYSNLDKKSPILITSTGLRISIMILTV